MHKQFFLILSLLTISVGQAQIVQPVNAVIGDESYISYYGQAPTSEVSDTLRIEQHLMYVEDLLRNINVAASGMPLELQTKRLELLNHLRDYRLAKRYPKNYDYPGTRKPCFIDKNGNICAVGYLVEKSVGRATAEYINSKFKYTYIFDIEDQRFQDWVLSSGFTLNELAMIQPTYDYHYEPVVRREPIEPDSAFLADTVPGKPKVIYLFVDSVPQFKGGYKGYSKFINENMKYPPYAIENGIQGTVYLSFVLNPEGKMEDITLLRGVSKGLDEEAIRLLKLTEGLWSIGKHAGRPVHVKQNIPVRFRLD